MNFLNLLAVLLIAFQTPEVDAILDKAGDYVTTDRQTFVGVVAEERYRQDVRGVGGVDQRGFASETAGQRRDLKSDMPLVRAPAGDRWVQFRDVFEVDGKPVRFTLEPATGRVLTSELIAENGSLRAQIDVSYALEPAMGLFVPREMREKYSLKDGSKIEGRATYARFRRYQVTVNETVK